jgi:hypothetical protein
MVRAAKFRLVSMAHNRVKEGRQIAPLSSSRACQPAMKMATTIKKE